MSASVREVSLVTYAPRPSGVFLLLAATCSSGHFAWSLLPSLLPVIGMFLLLMAFALHPVVAVYKTTIMS